RKDLEAAKTDEEKYSHAVTLAQLLLLQQKNREYVDLMAKTVLPLALKIGDANVLASFSTSLTLNHMQQLVVVATAGLTLMPLADPEFLATVTDKSLHACWPHLKALAEKSKDDFTYQGSRMLLFAVARKLGLEKEKQETAVALKARDQSFHEEQYDAKMKQFFTEVRQGLRMLMAGPIGLQ